MKAKNDAELLHTTYLLGVAIVFLMAILLIITFSVDQANSVVRNYNPTSPNFDIYCNVLTVIGNTVKYTTFLNSTFAVHENYSYSYTDNKTGCAVTVWENYCNYTGVYSVKSGKWTQVLNSSITNTAYGAASCKNSWIT